MERIDYEGGTGPRFMLLVFTRDDIGSCASMAATLVSPLYGPGLAAFGESNEKPGFSPRSFGSGPMAGG
jgi:hypothetical protein